MTREEIMRIETGLKLDRAVYRMLYQVDAYSPAYYSAHLECAFSALHLFLAARPGWGYRIDGDLEEVRVDLDPPGDSESFWWAANELPEAICRVILLAAEEERP